MKLLYEIEDKKQAKLIGSDRTKVELSENEIEDFFFSNPGFLGEQLLYIGRQITTSTGKRIDLLAINEHANILVLELKRGPAPREIIAQVLDYTSWLNTTAYLIGRRKESYVIIFSWALPE
jgi:RecB family endonuclease NucS